MSEAGTAQKILDMRAGILLSAGTLSAFLKDFLSGRPDPYLDDFDNLENRARGLANKCADLRDMEVGG